MDGVFVTPYSDPFVAFDAVWERVRTTAPDGFDPATIVLATADASGRPSARAVLLRGVSRDGFVVFTNYGSRKAAELEANPRAALCGFWFWLGQQVRIEGRVERAPAAESDAYFRARPRGSQLGAWASHQSAPLASRADLEARLREVSARFEGREVPRPEFWGGYRLVPDRFEFWEEGAYRLHDRMVFERAGDAWALARLSP
jgi:pyridoxamine 5'-phosphate oxidase